MLNLMTICKFNLCKSIKVGRVFRKFSFLFYFENMEKNLVFLTYRQISKRIQTRLQQHQIRSVTSFPSNMSYEIGTAENTQIFILSFPFLLNIVFLLSATSQCLEPYYKHRLFVC